VAGRTQAALYAEIDLELSWSEADLPQAQRTKHVHKLHPYLGKYVPQLVEVFLQRYFGPGSCVYDPFVGSGTTLVEANAFGADAIGCDVSAFNCLLARVKTATYPLGALELFLRTTLEAARRAGPAPTDDASDWLSAWFAPVALGELLQYVDVLEGGADPALVDVGRVIASAAARSARRTPHFDLDFPRTPTLEPYYCHKHKRTCKPVEQAAHFLSRRTTDTIRRIREFAEVRTTREVEVLHADARTVILPRCVDGIITSPPYPGLIDYHEQHRYAYELLGLEDRRDAEIGPAVSGTAQSALARYVTDMTAVFANAGRQLRSGAPIIIVVNDSRNLYPGILESTDLRLHEKLTRHVNRRTGRRAGEFFEDILICGARTD
jgi:hypothetical protein